MPKQLSRDVFCVCMALSALGAAAIVLLVDPAEAAACGGCLVPRENSSVVTDHRMVLSISATRTTLYDQIRYAGSPKSFAWVLPIRGTAEVGISSDAVFSVLSSQTSVQVVGPPLNCPPLPANCKTSFGSGPIDLAVDASVSQDASAVQVLKTETVGPYETVQLRSSDPTALTDWLVRNQFEIPASIQPIINAYVAEQFDFLALKLIPNAGVQSMRPVRVSTAGGTPVLPLRMVAAGTGPNVGLGLWIIGSGRWEPQNFPKFSVLAEDLTWRWVTQSSDFVRVRGTKAEAAGAAAFELESSLNLAPQALLPSIAFAAGNAELTYPDRNDRAMGNGDYQPTEDGKTALASFDADMTALFGSNPRLPQTGTGLVRITRYRADLPQASLASDLVLQASADQAEVARTRTLTREIGQPLCPVNTNCVPTGTAPRDQAQALTEAQSSSPALVGGTVSGTGCACDVSAAASSSGGVGALCMGLSCASMLVARARRRRTHRN